MIEKNFASIVIDDVEQKIHYDTIINHITSIGGICERILNDCDAVLTEFVELITSRNYYNIIVTHNITIDDKRTVHFSIVINFDDEQNTYHRVILHNQNNAYVSDIDVNFSFVISKLDYFRDYPNRKVDVENGCDKFQALLEYYVEVDAIYTKSDEDWDKFDEEEDYAILSNDYHNLQDDNRALKIAHEALQKQFQEIKIENEEKQKIIIAMSERMMKAFMILGDKE